MSTYAERWAEPINETYDDALEVALSSFDEDEITEILHRAAESLRNGGSVTFTGEELDIVRHLLPAHVVHQSGSLRYVREVWPR